MSFEHQKSSILKLPQNRYGKLCYQMKMTIDSTTIKLSVHACNFVLKVLDGEEPGARFWPKLMSKLQLKFVVYQNFSTFTYLQLSVP